ncbi:extracellular solute-binding protein [Patulibacter defluvii]|uniref:extracellular solute-binding protein n=1 Tax=Patulibacter defluvii TaxID=3095358 RepID=UPI002A75C377|nr:extracellular solute-binding protein [Patulibacter sp. DM4]
MLRLLAWPGMPDPEAVAEAGRRIGRTVEVETIAVNEELERRMATGHVYDVVCPSDYMVERLAAAGALAPLDDDRLPGRRHLADWARSPVYDRDETWSVPLAFGTTGYLYDRQRLGGDPESWGPLLAAGAGPSVGLLAEPREVIGAALLATGHETNDATPAALAAARRVLEGVAERVVRVDSDDFVGPVADGTVAVHHAWSGPSAARMRHDPRLGYAVPAEGAVLWTTTAAIPADAPDPDAAHALIEQLLDPQLAAITTTRNGYATPNAAARDRLDPALAGDPVLFPDEAVLRRLQVVRALPDADAARVDALWQELGTRWPLPRA